MDLDPLTKALHVADVTRGANYDQAAIHAGYFPYVIDRLEKTISAKSEAIESSVIAKVDAKDGDDNGLVF